MHVKLAVCASGEGSNFAAIVAASRECRLDAQIVGLIVNRAACGVGEKAKALGIPVVTLIPKLFSSRDEWDLAVRDQLVAWETEWVALAGFLARIGPAVLKAFPERIVNSHPALLPKYGGAGLYGDRVHAAVLAAREAETGITIHLVDEHYDHGKIVAQRSIPLVAGDTVHSLAQRLKSVENSFYPQVLQDLFRGQVTTR